MKANDIDVKTAIRELYRVLARQGEQQGTVETYEIWVNHYVQELMNELGIK